VLQTKSLDSSQSAGLPLAPPSLAATEPYEGFHLHVNWVRALLLYPVNSAAVHSRWDVFWGAGATPRAAGRKVRREEAASVLCMRLTGAGHPLNSATAN